MPDKPSVLFVCVHNAGRSQMAAGWLRHLAGDAVLAGTRRGTAGVPLTLLAVVTALAVAATGSRSYRRTRIAAPAGLGLIALDTGVLAAVVLIAPPFVWPMALAIPASLTRITLTVRAIPALLSATGIRRPPAGR